MVAVTLPDGSIRSYEQKTSGTDIARDISTHLEKAALAIKVNGVLYDLTHVVERDCSIEIITLKQETGVELDLVRHDTAHIMAQAVQELFPKIKVTIGPTIKDGFYYDFSRDHILSEEDFPAIEKRMQEIIQQNLDITREEWSRDEAIAYFTKIGENYKVEIIKDIPAHEPLTIYRQGTWLDLCRGPHAPSTGKAPTAFKLLKIAGAYWRGDSKNEMLQRIYATSWRDKKELKAYLNMIEEAEKRDHRRLGKEMDLFHFQEEARGQVFWHANGWSIYTALQTYLRRKQRKAGYLEVNTPQIVDRKLWEASGHWEKYQENMFIVEVDEEHAREKAINALKPMNCPCHVQIFNKKLKSYRELPLRIAEFGACTRYEPSGALHGLMRVRGFVQDDGHIFCTEEQIESETKEFIAFLFNVYQSLGFDKFKIKFSDRPKVRTGTDETWDRAEHALRTATIAAGYEFELNPGEGAFYGPKLEFVLTDSIGRDWQCGTLQVDFILPERLNASYIGSDSKKHTPIILHRATLGSFERFIGIMIENHAGKLPLWLAPQQAVICTITDESTEYAQKVHRLLEQKDLRVSLDTRNEKINYKVREHSLAKTQLILAVGQREREENTISLRRLGEKGQKILSLEQAIDMIVQESQPPE